VPCLVVNLPVTGAFMRPSGWFVAGDETACERGAGEVVAAFAPAADTQIAVAAETATTVAMRRRVKIIAFPLRSRR
jgi:hypothetical protein